MAIKSEYDDRDFHFETDSLDNLCQVYNKLNNIPKMQLKISRIIVDFVCYFVAKRKEQYLFDILDDL